MRAPSKTSQGKPVDPLAAHLGYQLRRAAVLMQTDLSKRLSELGVNMVEMSTLLIIEVNPGISPAQIGRMINVHRANMAPITTNLVSRGLIEARPVDGRSIGLHLTQTGVAMVADIRVRVEENEKILFRNIPPAQRQGLMDQINSIWSDDA